MIDCGVHPALGHLHDLVPWLDPEFREYVLHGGYGGYALPGPTWAPGTRPRSADYERMRDGLLDPLGVEYAILTSDELLAVSAIPNGPLAAALATAYNRRLVEEWLPRDGRLRGSLVVAPQEPEHAAAEIRRAGSDRDIVQVVVSCGSVAGYGDPRYEPIWHACAELGLPLALHAGAEGIGINAPPTATGYPRTELEFRTLLPTACMSHLASVIAHGSFERFPDVRLAIVPSGVEWLPGFLSRLDSTCQSLNGGSSREELPSETIRRRVRLAVSPLDEPPDGDLGEMLMLASGFPQVDLDRLDPARLARRWGATVTSENARGFYRLPARAHVA